MAIQDSMAELTKQEATDLVAAFVNKIKKPTNHTTGYIDGETSNRGNKLKFGADLVHRDHINGFNNDIEAVESVEFNRSTRTVFKRRRVDYQYDDDDYEDDVDDNPYLDIDIEEILRPINHPSELSNRPTISRTYTNNVFRHYAQQSIEIIEKEQDSVNQLSRLLELFLGEDSSVLLEDGLKLAEYNMNTETDANEKETVKRLTRKTTTDEIDPFFALPSFNIDTNQGLKQSDAEDARQLTQLAVQRTQEFIANLTKVRNGLVKAQSIKEKLYQWGKEMNGDPDESDLYTEREVILDSSNDGTATPPKRSGRRRAQ